MIPKEEILKKLYKYPYCEEQIFKDFSKDIPQEEYEQLYSYLIDILCDVEINVYEAKNHFENICAHRREMEKALGRSVGFRVGMLDYFMNEKRKLQNPKVIELATYEKKLKLADVDELTGLYNRRYFIKSVNTELQRSRRYDLNLSLMMIDLDDFKKVNDNFGHPAGDSVLKDFAQIITTIIRAEDIAARYGGEEFVILIPQTNSLSGKILHRRLAEAVAAHEFTHKEELTFSAGLAEFPRHANTVEELIKKSDKALYSAKAAGKNRLTILEEKRDSKRYHPSTRVSLAFEGTSPDAGEIKDVSLGGLSFEVSQMVNVGDVMNLVIDVPNDNKKYEIRSEIIWVKEEDISKKTVGARFQSIDEKKLHELIKRISVA